MIRSLTMTACVLLMMGGCSSGPAPRTFLLDPPLQYAAAPAAGPAGPLIQVPTVTLPDYLDTEDILLREGAHGLTASAGARWGERLSAGMTHALTAALVNRLSDYRVIPARPADPLARQVLVDVTAFDVGRDGRCELRASWTITTPGAVSPALARQAVFVTPAAGASHAADATVVAAMAATVDRLADALALDIAAPGSAQVTSAR
jgi:uncharacterized lipoprotein YmbA